MVKDNIKIKNILLITLFLSILISIISISDVGAVENNITINNTNNTTIQTNVTVILFDDENKTIVHPTENDTIHTEYPKITIRGKPSCQTCHKYYPYKWFTKTWINYCPHCKQYNGLLINPKRVYESELTCKYCDSDYCIVCGHDKCANYYKHRNYYLIELKKNN